MGGLTPEPFLCDPGGAASGSFTYDAATGIVSEWSIAVTGGDVAVFPPFTWDSDNSSDNVNIQVSPWLLNFVSDLATPYLFPRQIRLVFDAPLPDAYGVVPLNLETNSGVECYNCSPYRWIISGEVVAAPPAVPEPATLLLLSAGLAVGFRSLRRRR